MKPSERIQELIAKEYQDKPMELLKESEQAIIMGIIDYLDEQASTSNQA